jgi:hypothetical protein
LDTNILKDHAVSIFIVEVCGEWKVEIDIRYRQDMRRGRVKVGYSVIQQKALEESALNRA